MSINDVDKYKKIIADVRKKFMPEIKKCAVSVVQFIGRHKFESLMTTVTALLAIDNLKVRASRNNERKKNKLFQEALRKHQAEIDALKNLKEREEYKNQLWKEIMNNTGE